MEEEKGKDGSDVVDSTKLKCCQSGRWMAGKVGHNRTAVFLVSKGTPPPPSPTLHTHTNTHPEIGVTVFHCQREEKGVEL